MPNQLFFTPGPSQLYHTVPYHLKQAISDHIGSISHRSTKFQEIYGAMKLALTQVLELPDNYHILTVASATEVWERILQNLVISQSHHLVNGSFSQRFFDFTQQYQLDSTCQKVGFGADFDLTQIPENSELISITYNETSIGYSFTSEQLQAVRKNHPEAIIALDVVSVSPAVKIDFSQIDTAYLSVQKCFGLPAGLGIWIVNDRCLEKAIAKKALGHIIGSYHALPELLEQSAKNQTPETPNVLSIYLLKHVAEAMLERGLAQIHNETKYKATLLYQLFENHNRLTPFIPSKPNRSQTVCVANVAGGNEELIKNLKQKGLIIGSGYGPYKSQHIRIANFPAHSKESVEMLVDLISTY